MSLALVLLRNGTSLVSQIDQLEYEPKVHLTNPHTISGKAKLTLNRWPEYATDTHILLRSEELLTVCELEERVVKSYLNKLGLTEADLQPAPQPAMLTEEATPEQEDMYEDEYEPRYVEDF